MTKMKILYSLTGFILHILIVYQNTIANLCVEGMKHENIHRSWHPLQPSFVFQRPMRLYNHYSSMNIKSSLKMVSQPASPHRSSSSSSSSKSKSKIIMEKVYRSVPIAIIIEYIRDIFILPSELTMPYESLSLDSPLVNPLINQQKHSNYKKGGGTIVKAFYSPISDNNDDTLIWVEVLGVYLKRNETIPQMVMVAVKKKQDLQTLSLSSSMMGLYQDCEKQIIRALEYGLDDYLYEYPHSSNKQENVDIEKKPKTFAEQLTSTSNDFNPMVIDVDVNVDVDVDVNVESTNDDESDLSSSQATTTTATTNNNNNEMIDIETSKSNIKEDIEKEVMDTMTDDITPEELLQKVLDFDKEQSKEEQVGYGFTQGAMDKAKELIQHQQTKNNNNNNNNIHVSYKEKDDHLDIIDCEIPNEQEELRRIFQAGERLAEGKMTTTTTTSTSIAATTTILTEQDIDDLIASDQTIPKVKVKATEDDLAELEIRINRNPGDAPITDPVFDLFSKPTSEKMELNDPLDVNYPGALPDTKDVQGHGHVQLPSDLNDAVRYAKFASETLSQIRQDANNENVYYIGKTPIDKQKVKLLETYVEEAVQAGFIDVHPLQEMEERARLTILLNELKEQSDEERFDDIVNEYKDLLLSDRFVSLIKERLIRMANREQQRRQNQIHKQYDNNDHDEDAKDIMEREHLRKLTRQAMILLKETRALGAELEVSQLEVIRSICQVAMNPKYETEEEASIALTDTVRGMRPLLDDSFVSYLKYAIAEEEGRLRRRGLLEDPEHNCWLFVLMIVQEGVYAELGREVNRYITHIEYILRMETKQERKELLKKIVDVMPSMDVRPFVKIVDNIVASLGTSARGEFSDANVLGGMTKQILQLSNDLKEILPPERIQLMSKDADEWAARQRKKMMEQKEETRKRLIAKREQQALIEGNDNLGIQRLP